MLKSTHLKKFFQNIFVIFSFLLIIVLDSSANKLEIKYGYPNQSIFIATVNNKEQLRTPILFVAKELFTRADISWTSTAYPAKRLFRNLKNGETDFSILVRASSLIESCIFSKKPIYSTSLNVYYIGDKPQITTREDLIGTNIVTIRGYSYGSLGKFINDPKNNISKEITNTHSSAFRMLELGRVDYLLDYESAAQDIISKKPISKLQSNKISNLDIFLVLSKSYPNADKLMKKLETIAESMDISKIISESGIN